MLTPNTVITDKSDNGFNEKSYLINKIKTDIFESKFEIIVKMTELEKYSSVNGFEKSDFEIVSENRYLHNQKVGFDYYLISVNDKIKVTLKDTIANRIHEAKVEGEAILEKYSANKKEMNGKIFKKKISEFGNRFSIDVISEEIRDTENPILGRYSISVPSEHLEFTEVMPYIDSLAKTYYSLVELEKQLLDLKINRIDDYLEYLKLEKAKLRKFSEDLNVTVIQLVDVDNSFEDSKEDLLDKLKNIHNYISKHGGKIRNLEDKYSVDKISGLVLKIKKIREFEDYFDVIEVGFSGLLTFGVGTSMSEYLTDYSTFEKNFVDSLMGKNGGMVLSSIRIDRESSINSQLEESENDEFYDKVYLNNLKSASKLLNSGKEFVRIDDTFYVKTVSQEKIMDLSVMKISEDYELNESEKSVMDGVNVYLKITSSNYKTF